MLKHIYRIIILCAVFIGSLFYFSRDIKEVVFHIDSTTQMSEATFPVVTLKTQDSIINMMHGYAATMDSNQIRDSITPLNDTQNVFIYIDEKESTVKKLNYELRDTFDNHLIESGSYSALEKSGSQKIAKLKLTSELVTGKEYALTITTVTAESKKVNYYTRVVLQPSQHVEEKLEYAKQIHDALLRKDTVETVSQFFEPKRNADNTSYGKVDIYSDIDLIGYGNLNPQVITAVVPTIKEISSDIASIEFDYYIQGTTESGDELFYVKEFFRVKYTPSRMYLLNYDRSMDARFDPNQFVLNEGLIKLGICSDETADLYISEGATSLCFVRNGELWYYSLDENKLIRIFSFEQKKTDYIRDLYNQHDIRVINMDVEGAIDFVVTGYMNRGNYEGRVGMILYRYYPSDTRIEELVYIPVNVPYQVLRENIGDFQYITFNDVYYFMLNQTIYSYNITTKSLTNLVQRIDEKSYVFSKEAGYIAWEDLDEDGLAKTITVMDLESQAMKTFTAGNTEYIHLLGKIDENIIYGFAKEQDVYIAANGDLVLPCNKIIITDAAGTIKKTYSKQGYYVSDVVVTDNVVNLIRLKKTDSGFVATEHDHILNQIVTVQAAMEIHAKESEQTLREYYIRVTNGQPIEKKPKKAETVATIITEETAIRLEETALAESYYVYAYGEILGKYRSAGEAVVVADQNFGIVVNQNQQIVWARGTKNAKVALEVTPILSGNGKSTMDACILMLSELTKGKQYPISDVFRSKYLRDLSTLVKATMVNLTGASIDQIEYYINKGRPVIAIDASKKAMLIVGYDGSSLNILDPQTGRVTKKLLKIAENEFSEAGNVFLSFIE